MQSIEALERIRVPQLEGILGKPFPVLDDGFVRVIDYMGSDEAVVQAARVSYGKGTKKVSEDRTLIRYLMRHRHTTPFEMCEIKLHLRVPMDCWRQWIRHRTASVNEYSTRYSLAIDASQATAPDAWRLQAVSNRQGSSGFLDPESGKKLSVQEKELQDFARKVYGDRIGHGIAREQARKDLPLSTYTEAYWKIDLSNLLHFLSLRMEANAQLEIRMYAETIGNEIVRRWCPHAWQAFEDYVLRAVFFSADELKILTAMLSGDVGLAVKSAEELGWMEMKDGKLKPNYERAEFEEKLKGKGISPPWADRSR
jgi:thymidylate synthase (FAD)